MLFLSCFLLILFKKISSPTWVTSWKQYSSQPLTNNEEKENKTKMYTRMCWNHIVQLMFSHRHGSPLCFVQFFLFCTTYNLVDGATAYTV